MIKYILVDDDQKTLDRVKFKLDNLPKYYELEYVSSYNSSKVAAEDINPEDYDLLIVDFEMPVYNGIELAERVARNKKVIFLTSTTDNEKLVINAIDIAGYLNKPFDLEEFTTLLKNKVIGNISRVSKILKTVNIQIGVHKDIQFLPESVYYITTSRNCNGKQPDKNCVHIYGKQDDLLFANVRKSINSLSQELINYNFEKLNQSTIINMSHIKERDNVHLELHNCKETFEIKSSFKESLISKIRSAISKL